MISVLGRSRSCAAVYGSTSRAAIRSTSRGELARLEHRRSRCSMNAATRARAAGTRCARGAAPPAARAACARNCPIASTSSATPAPVVAIVFRIGGRHSPSAVGRAAPGCASTADTSRSAPSRSALLTTKMSAISMMPALSACTRRRCPGTSVDDRHVGGADDVDFVLADADGFDDDDRPCRRRRARARHRRSRAPGRRDAARRHAADEHAVVGRCACMRSAIAEHRAAGERAGRIDGDHADGRAARRELGRSGDRPACSCRRRADR